MVFWKRRHHLTNVVNHHFTSVMNHNQEARAKASWKIWVHLGWQKMSNAASVQMLLFDQESGHKKTLMEPCPWCRMQEYRIITFIVMMNRKVTQRKERKWKNTRKLNEIYTPRWDFDLEGKISYCKHWEVWIRLRRGTSDWMAEAMLFYLTWRS